MGQNFDQTLFGSLSADSLAALGFLLLFASLTFRSAHVRIASIMIFGVGIALYVTGSNLLQAIGIVTLPSLAASLAAVTVGKKRFRRNNEVPPPLVRSEICAVIGAFLLIIIALEIGALAKWSSYPLYPTQMYGDSSWRFAELESALFHSMGLLSPFLVVLIAFSFFYKWFILNGLKKIANVLLDNKSNSGRAVRECPRSSAGYGDKMDVTYRDYSQPVNEVNSGGHVITTHVGKPSSIIVRHIQWTILSVALVIAPMVAIYPHLPGVNPEGSGVSTDEQYYMNWMSQLRADRATWADTIANAFTINKGDRPLTLLLILAVANMTGSPDLMVIRYLPVALAPMLVIANYVLLRYSLKSKEDGKIKIYASIGAIFAVFSPQIVVGEYAGLLANWLALVAAYFAFYFLIRGWDSQSRNQMIYSFGVLFAVLFAMILLHLYTWAHFMVVILLFAGMSYIFARKSAFSPRIKLVVMLAIVATSFSIDYVKSYFFVTPAAAGSGSAIGSNVQPQDTNGRWDRLFFTLNTYVGGFLSNPVLLLPALIWMVRTDLSRGIDRLLLSMFFILAVPITFGGIEFQTRVLYNIPFHIPVLLALMFGITRAKDGLTARHLLLVTAISLVLATYTLRAMANLYLELPQGYVLEDQFLLP